MRTAAMTDTPLDIVLISPGMPHFGGVLAQRTLGGSETAALNVAEALARLGHQPGIADWTMATTCSMWPPPAAVAPPAVPPGFTEFKF